MHLLSSIHIRVTGRLTADPLIQTGTLALSTVHLSD